MKAKKAGIKDEANIGGKEIQCVGYVGTDNLNFI